MAHPIGTIATILLLTATDTPSWTPQAELDCHPFAEIIEQLHNTYGQQVIGGGALHATGEPNAGGLVILATPRGETWTLVVLTSDGKNACMGAWGRNWQQSLVGRKLPA